MQEVKLQLNPDNLTLEFDNNKIKVKRSTKENNGLSFVNGKLVATKAPDGSGGTPGSSNTSGNAIGPITADATTPLPVVGFNSTVSRHIRYTGVDEFIIENDGPVMTRMDGDHLLVDGSIAAYMITHEGGSVT